MKKNLVGSQAIERCRITASTIEDDDKPRVVSNDLERHMTKKCGLSPHVTLFQHACDNDQLPMITNDLDVNEES